MAQIGTYLLAEQQSPGLREAELSGWFGSNLILMPKRPREESGTFIFWILFVLEESHCSLELAWSPRLAWTS